MPIRVVVAEDDYLLREGVVRLLETADELEVVAACDSYDSVAEAVRVHEPDVVLTDIRMPPTGTDEGIRLALELRESHPSIGVVVLSQYVEPDYALSLLGSGSQGRAYLVKERVAEIDELVAAIVTVANGGSVVDPKVVDALVTANTAAESPLRYLTPREMEVLAEIAAGRNNAATADALGLSQRAVEKHINSIFSKLGLGEEPDIHRRVSAVLMFLDGRG